FVALSCYAAVRRCQYAQNTLKQCSSNGGIRTGVPMSLLGLGGWHIGAVQEKAEATCIRHAALDERITFFDNAWDYHNGKNEEWIGEPLAVGGKRSKAFLMTKNCERVQVP